MRGTARSAHGRMVTVLAVAAFIAGIGVAVSANAEEDQVTLVGCLDASTSGTLHQGSFTLIEQESGDWIPVEGPDALADNVGKIVELVGAWEHDEADSPYFVAQRFEVVAESCED